MGDKFGFNSYEKYYFQRSKSEYEAYVKENYEMSGFMAGELELDNCPVSRLRNNILMAIEKQPILPKLIVIVPDDDILEYIANKNDMSSYSIGRVLHWLMQQINKAISSELEYLPTKAKLDGFPHTIFIEAPTHIKFRNNELREKFNTCMRNMAKLVENTSVLALKKIWDANDIANVAENKNLTVHGHKQYWEAVDRTVKYADSTFIAKKEVNLIKKRMIIQPEDTQNRQNSHKNFTKQNNTGFSYDP